MGQPTMTLPVELVQRMANVLRELPYQSVAPILNDLSTYKANPTLEEVTAPGDDGKEGAPPAS